MKKVVLLCVLLCVLFSMFAVPYSASAKSAESHVVMSYNIDGTTDTSIGAFDVIQNYRPDLIVLNEVNYPADGHLMPMLENIGYAYFGTTDWAPDSPEETVLKAGWRNYACYDTDKYTLLDAGTFSLSDNPEDYHAFFSSMDDDTKMKKEGRPRHCSWLYLESKETRERFIFAAAHVQWASNATTNFNQLGLEVLAKQLSKLSSLYDCDVICGGDMNANTDDMKPVTDKGFYLANNDNSLITFPGENSSIDNIFYSVGFSSSDFKVGTEYDYSDHKPICVTITRDSSGNVNAENRTTSVIVIGCISFVVVLVAVIYLSIGRKKSKI